MQQYTVDSDLPRRGVTRRNCAVAIVLPLAHYLDFVKVDLLEHCSLFVQVMALKET